MTVGRQPTTVRFDDDQRAVLDVIARRKQRTRSNLVRRAVSDFIAREAAAQRTTGTVVAGGDLGAHTVTFTLPAVPDAAPEELKTAVVARNAATLHGSCDFCGCEPEPVVGTAAAIAAGARRDAAAGPIFVNDAAGTAVQAGRSVPTAAAVLRRLAPLAATTVAVRFDHRAGCPARGGGAT